MKIKTYTSKGRIRKWQYLHVTLQKREKQTTYTPQIDSSTCRIDAKTTGDYSRSHRVSLKGYYKGRKIAKANEAKIIEGRYHARKYLHLNIKNLVNACTLLQKQT